MDQMTWVKKCIKIGKWFRKRDQVEMGCLNKMDYSKKMDMKLDND